MNSRESSSEFTLELRQRIAAEPARIFAAWTTPDQIRSWLKPTPEFSHGEILCDVKEGGEYTIEFISPEETHHIVQGEYRQVDPPGSLAFTWTWKEGNPDHMEIETLVQIELKSGPDGTELLLRHAGHKDEEMKESHLHGWSGALEQLVATYSA